ncbi:hypothetical protein NKG05_14155 [Oerskovia sp. M15]
MALAAAGCRRLRREGPQRRRHVLLEEWEVLGYENLDFWVEYDHYTKAVTLYRPAESKEHLDPTRMRKGRSSVSR